MSLVSASPQEPALYLFSSNSLPLYLQNMLNVLAQPYGAIDKVRYSERWVSLEFQRQGPGEKRIDWEARLQDYVGKRALIVLLKQPLNMDHEKKSDADLRFYPLRYATVTKLQWDGNVLFVFFQLGHYVDWHGPDAEDLRRICQEKRAVGARRTYIVADFLIEFLSGKFYPRGMSRALTQRRREEFADFEAQLLAEVDSEIAKLSPGSSDIEENELGVCQTMKKLETKIADLIGEEYDARIKTLGPDQRPKDKFASVETGEGIYIPEVPTPEATRGWQSIVERLGGEGGIDEYKNAVFYRLDKVAEIPSPDFLRRLARRFKFPRAAEELPLSEVLPDRSGYKLVSNRNYVLTLSFYRSEAQHLGSQMGHPIRGSKIVPIVDKTYFTLPTSEIEVNFDYDIRPIPLVVTSVSQDTITTFSTELVPPPNQQPPAQCSAPQLNLLFLIRVPGNLWLWLIVLFSAQVLASSPAVVKWIPGFAQLSDDFIKVFGSALTAIMIFLLYRRLPGGGK
jgi:hypothetical protein